MLKIRVRINFMVRSEQMLHSGRLQPRLNSKDLPWTDTLAYMAASSSLTLRRNGLNYLALQSHLGPFYYF